MSYKPSDQDCNAAALFVGLAIGRLTDPKYHRQIETDLARFLCNYRMAGYDEAIFHAQEVALRMDEPGVAEALGALINGHPAHALASLEEESQ